MSRLPVVMELAGGKSQRQRVWEAIRSLSACALGGGEESRWFAADDLSRQAKIEMPVVREYCKCLVAAGYLRSATSAAGRGVKTSFALDKDNGIEAPRVRRDGSPVTQGSGTQAMWDAITVLDSFTPAFLAELAMVKPATAANYCGYLYRAGYLTLLKPGHGTGRGGVASVWSCARAHRKKPRAPMITRLKAVYDPNIHEIVWREDAGTAADQWDAGEVIE
ncbi:hypothetical protein [Candidatus Accumulibacter contiguus]|jgi:hypothetical protein|uniref:hypothetical protein n=1 Tax=Candidatus Accumulibacter contiguus TaxID=2954381 RepID=UPI002FC2A279